LLALPGELRNEIWKLVLSPDCNGRVDLVDEYVELYRRRRRLLLCCRGIRNDARGLFPQIRDKFLTEAQFTISTQPEGSSCEYLKILFRFLDRMEEEEIALIKSVELRSDGHRIEHRMDELPTCKFSGGSWHCTWLPPFPNVPWSHDIIQYSIARDRVEAAIADDLDCVFVDEYYPKVLGVRCHFRAIVMTGDATKEHVKAVVAASGWEKLTKEELRYMLAFQWAKRIRWP
jgi:hypothetical protein